MKITVYKHVMQKYAKHVGLKRDFRLVVRGAARNMIKILNGSGKLSENLFYFPEHLMLYFFPSVFIFYSDLYHASSHFSIFLY